MSDSQAVDDLSFDLLVTFVHVAQTGTMAAAADILKISRGAVSKRIEALEKWLRYPLLMKVKGKRSPILTFEGERFAETAFNIVGALEGARGSKVPFHPSEVLNGVKSIYENSDESRLPIDSGRRLYNGGVVITETNKGKILLD